jgi:hypothetical protein
MTLSNSSVTVIWAAMDRHIPFARSPSCFAEQHRFRVKPKAFFATGSALNDERSGLNHRSECVPRQR